MEHAFSGSDGAAPEPTEDTGGRSRLAAVGPAKGGPAYKTADAGTAGSDFTRRGGKRGTSARVSAVVVRKTTEGREGVAVSADGHGGSGGRRGGAAVGAWHERASLQGDGTAGDAGPKSLGTGSAAAVISDGSCATAVVGNGGGAPALAITTTGDSGTPLATSLGTGADDSGSVLVAVAGVDRAVGIFEGLGATASRAFCACGAGRSLMEATAAATSSAVGVGSSCSSFAVGASVIPRPTSITYHQGGPLLAIVSAAMSSATGGAT